MIPLSKRDPVGRRFRVTHQEIIGIDEDGFVFTVGEVTESYQRAGHKIYWPIKEEDKHGHGYYDDEVIPV